MTDLQTRLRATFDYLKSIGVVHTQTQMAEALGMRITHLNDAFRGNERRLTLGLMKRVAAAYSDYINEAYLLEGAGELAKPDPAATRPHVPILVAAGPMGKTIEAAMQSELEPRPIIPGFDWYDFTVTASGDSMEPVISDGDILACVWEAPGFEPRPGRPYVLDTTDGAVVKLIAREDPATVRCSSYNHAYSAYTIPADTVLRAARVVGLIRHFK